MPDEFTDEDRAAADALLSGGDMPPALPADLADLYAVPSIPEPPRSPERTAELTPQQQAELERFVRAESAGPVVIPGASPLGPAHVVPSAAERAEQRRERERGPRISGAQQVPFSAPPAPPGESAGAQPPGEAFDPAATGGKFLRSELLSAATPRPGGVKRIPEADILQKYSVARTAPLSPEAIAGIEAGYEGQQAVAEAEGEKARALGFQSALQHRMAADAAQEQLEAFRERETAKRDAWAAQQKKLRDVMATAKQVDPDQIWEGREGARIAAAIFMGLGEFGRALTKSDRNMAAEIIKDAVDRNIAAQREAKAQGIALTNALLDDMGRQLLSPESFESMARAYQLEAAQQQVAAQAAMQGGEVAAMNAQKMIADIDLAKAQALADVEAREKGAVSETFRHQQAQTIYTGGGGGTGAAWKRYQKYRGGKGTVEEFARIMETGRLAEGGGGAQTPQQQRLDWDRARDVSQREIRLADGTIAYVAQPSEAPAVKAEISALDQLAGNMERLLKLRQEQGSVYSNLSPAARAEIDEKVQENTQLLQSAVVKNALQEGETKRLTTITGKVATDWVGAEEKLTQGIAGVERFRAATRSRLSADPYKSVPLDAATEGARSRAGAPVD